ncbi:transposase [Fructilactobacillus sanfranciscensis]
MILSLVALRPVEGTNNKIKAIKRTAYGFRNFFNFRAHILLALPNSYIAINWNHKRTAHAKFQTRAARKLILFSHQYFLTKSHNYLILFIC